MAISIHDLLKRYAFRVRGLLRANALASEPAIAPIFQELLEAILPTLPAVPQLTVAPEYQRPGIGRPDIAFVCAGQPARAFIELKAPTKDANPERWRGAHDKRQRERLNELAHWATSNFADFMLFSREECLGSAPVVPDRALRADTPDATADALIERVDPAPFLELLAQLARADAPVAKDAEELATLMAHSARILRSAVEERVGELHLAGTNNDPLMLVRNTFKDVLYAHPEAGGYPARDFDALFASAFAQTLAFGLLLVREASEQPVGNDAWKQMPDEHPLMRAALRVLSEEEVTTQIGIGYDVMRDTVNSFAKEILLPGRDGRDPILYFYEDFLKTFDPAARDKYGVYYTPIEVVRYMSGALDRALQQNLGTRGLRDPAVTILDPATGTGTFLLGIAERVRDQTLHAEGGPAAAMALRDLAGRMFGFELLVGPYAVAHYRLHHALRYRPPDEDETEVQPVQLPRLGVYLADTLAEPDAATGIGQLGIAGLPIDDERQRANEIKARRQVLAIIGNPPYKRLEEGETGSLVGRWMGGSEDTSGIWDDLKEPVRHAGQGNQLNTFPEFSVAFWRWAIWKLFEAENAPQRGVIAFITNRKFLTGWPYAGLRQMMRRRFDRIEVIDLRGDVRAGPRAGVEIDQGVFNIMVGTAITLAIADGSKLEGDLAEVVYSDAWRAGQFRRRSKLDWLTSGATAGEIPGGVTIDRRVLEDWRPPAFEDGAWLSIREIFSYVVGGVQTKRDDLIYGVTANELRGKVNRFLALTGAQAAEAFHDTRDRKWVSAQNVQFSEGYFTQTSYRPLDVRILYNHRSYGDFLRPDLQACWGAQNFGLYALKSNTGAGPAIWCHGLLPDYHSIKGSNGGYAFPLFDRRRGIDTNNLNPALLRGLAEAYGEIPTAQDVFDAVLCLLSAKSYTSRFAEDLEDTFPHVPFPADPAVFARTVELGRAIRLLECFDADAVLPFKPKSFCKLASEPTGPVAGVDYADGAIALCADGSGRMTGIPPEVWGFSVSGYRVLPRWIEARRGLPAAEVWQKFRDVAARIAGLIHHFAEADLVLQATLAHTLTRQELGFPEANPDLERDQRE